MFGQTVGWHPESRTVHRRRQSEYRSAPYCASLRLYERHPFEQAFLSSDRQTGKVAALYPALLQPDAYCRDGGACSGHAHPWNLRQGLNGLICFHPFTQPSLNLSDLCVQRLQPIPLCLLHVHPPAGESIRDPLQHNRHRFVQRCPAFSHPLALFSQPPTQAVDLPGSKLHELRTHSVQRYDGLLSFRLHGNALTRLLHGQTRPSVGKVLQQFRTLEPLVHDLPRHCIYGVHLEHRLCNLHSNGRKLLFVPPVLRVNPFMIFHLWRLEAVGRGGSSSIPPTAHRQGGGVHDMLSARIWPLCLLNPEPSTS